MQKNHFFVREKKIAGLILATLARPMQFPIQKNTILVNKKKKYQKSGKLNKKANV